MLEQILSIRVTSSSSAHRLESLLKTDGDLVFSEPVGRPPSPIDRGHHPGTCRLNEKNCARINEGSKTGRIGRVLECQFVKPQRETGKTTASTISIASG